MDYFPPFDLDPCSANFMQWAVRLILKASPEVQALGACQHDLPSPEGKYNWYQCLSWQRWFAETAVCGWSAFSSRILAGNKMYSTDVHWDTAQSQMGQPVCVRVFQDGLSWSSPTSWENTFFYARCGWIANKNMPPPERKGHELRNHFCCIKKRRQLLLIVKVC